MAAKTPLSLKGRALQLLALRDYSRLEMEQRLLRWLQVQHAKDAKQAGIAPACDEAGDEAGDESGNKSGNESDDRLGNAPDHAPDAEALLHQHRRAVAEVLDAMQAKGYLSDQRSAQSLVQRRSGQFGVLRIRQELKTKGIALDVSQNLLEALRESETARAHAVWQKRFGQLPATLAERAKQMRYLASRGFGADAVRAVLRGVGADEYTAADDVPDAF